MPTTLEQMETVRSWVGEEWDREDATADIDTRYDKFFAQTQSAEQALYFTVVEIVRTQLSRMVNDAPGSMSIEGMSVSTTTNMATLRQTLERLESGAGVEVGTGTAVVPQHRVSPR